MSSHLLVRHHAVGLQWSWMSTKETSSWPIMFTEDSPIDVVKAVARDQTVPAGRTGKTLRKKESNSFICNHTVYYQVIIKMSSLIPA